MKKISILAVLTLLSCNQPKSDKSTSDAVNTVGIENNDTLKDAAISNSKNIERQENLLIVPGQSIGETHLFDYAETLQKFGKPTFSDAAMGKAWTVWTGKGIDITGNNTSLAVYSTYNGSDMTKKVVKKIRVTSADFKTSLGAHTGMTFSEISQLYKNLQLESKWLKRDSQIITDFYTEKNVGIGFEFEKINSVQTCVAIVVAPADEINNVPYLLLDSDQIQQ